MNLSARPIYSLPVKAPIIITRINVTGADTSEYMAKPFQPSVDLNRINTNIIAAIISIPDITIRIKCILPLQVINSPPASNGKKQATSTPKNELMMKRTGPAMDPFPLFTPQCNPR